MKKVVSISLNGIAYQLEEAGYEELRVYLERAEARLKDSPDRAEVMADLEQAIGEKCARALGPHKTVVSSAEISGILSEMGPVETADEKPAEAPSDAGFSGAAAASASSAVPPPRKRLFKIREGQMWSGVCNGIAAYLGVDVTWVRIAFVAARGVHLRASCSWCTSPWCSSCPTPRRRRTARRHSARRSAPRNSSAALKKA